MAADSDKPSALFCKYRQNSAVNEPLYARYFPAVPGTIAFRSLDLKTDLGIIHYWVNQPYSKKFWQLDANEEEIKQMYEDILKSPDAHSIVGLINEKPFCQIDLYMIGADQLKNHVKAGINDCGLHLLMLPPKELKKGWSVWALRAFQDYYFSFSDAEKLFAEPDRGNGLANQLALKTGFDFIKTVSLSHKEANLYSISREKFRTLNMS
jgi:RimJ/RimL family protein N-acetyltransferase